MSTFAQCDPATIDEMPTVYANGYLSNYEPTAEQEKYTAAIYYSVEEAALKTTKGLKGSWQPIGGFKATAEGLILCDIRM